MKKTIDEIIAFLGGKKAYGITAGIIAGLYLIAGIVITVLKLLGYGINVIDNKVNTPATTVVATTTPTPEPTEESEPSEPVTLKKGESVTIGDTTYSMKSYDTDYKVTGLSSLLQDKPEEYNYLKVEFYLTNNSKYTEYYSLYEYDCYADNAECDIEYSQSDSSGSAESGRAVLLTGVWMVPKDAKSIEIECEPGLSSDQKIIFKIK